MFNASIIPVNQGKQDEASSSVQEGVQVSEVIFKI